METPKLYFYDTDLLCHLLKIKSVKQFQTDRLKGNLFENMIIAEFQKTNYHLYKHQKFYFWQDSNGNEIDLLWFEEQECFATEIKATQTITGTLFKQLDKFESGAEIKMPIQKLLVYGGNTSQRRTHYKVKSWREI